MAHALVREIEQAGSHVLTQTHAASVHDDGHALDVETTRGVMRTQRLVGCAGLYADRLARVRARRGRAHRAVPQYRSPPRARRPPHLPGARSALSVPRRPFHAARERRDRSGTERGARVRARGLHVGHGRPEGRRRDADVAGFPRARRPLRGVRLRRNAPLARSPRVRRGAAAAVAGTARRGPAPRARRRARAGARSRGRSSRTSRSPKVRASCTCSTRRRPPRRRASRSARTSPNARSVAAATPRGRRSSPHGDASAPDARVRAPR